MRLSFKEAVRVASARQKLTQDQVAERAYMNKRTLCRKISDPGTLRLDELLDIGGAVGWTIDQTIGVLAETMKELKGARV